MRSIRCARVLVECAADWPYSSVRALSGAPRRRARRRAPLLDRAPNFSDFFGMNPDDSGFVALRPNELIGRGRVLTPGKRGPKPKRKGVEGRAAPRSFHMHMGAT